jgi:prolyl-tRNA synthetase
MLMLGEYVKLAQDYLAIPVIAGRKTDTERFPGAEVTMTFEAVMQDGKALQMGTSHLLSQTFAKAFNIVFQNQDKQQAHPYLTSWGTTTRLIGALVMTHGDQAGLVMPPRIAPIQVVIIPILMKDTDNQTVLDTVSSIHKELKGKHIQCHVDDRDYKTPGNKFYEWELKGVPLRLEIGPRDLKQGQATVVQRVNGEKKTIALDQVANEIPTLLENIHTLMFEKAYTRLKSQWHKAAKLSEFGPTLAEHNGLYQTGWCGDAVCEQKLKEYKAFTRCLIDEHNFAECFYCTRQSKGDVLVAKAY